MVSCVVKIIRFRLAKQSEPRLVARQSWSGSVERSRNRGKRLPLKVPEPKILLAGAVAIPGLEAAALGHGDSGFVGERHAEPRVVGLGGQARVALDLEFEQSSGTQQPVDFA